MNPETEVFMGVIATAERPDDLNIAHWTFDGSFHEAKTGRLWLDGDAPRIAVGCDYLLTGGFKRWLVKATAFVGRTSENKPGRWLFETVEEIW